MKENQEISKKEFRGLKNLKTSFKGKTYDECVFINCDLSDADISKSRFIDCKFDNCNFSLVNLKNTRLQNVSLVECKILGVNFGDCDNFMLQFNFKNCFIKNSYFTYLRITRTKFIECNIEDSEFSYADISYSDFSGSSLKNTIFINCDMNNSDFRTAKDYSINPTKNEIHNAKFSFPGVLGLLEDFDIEIE